MSEAAAAFALKRASAREIRLQAMLGNATNGWGSFETTRDNHVESLLVSLHVTSRSLRIGSLAEMAISLENISSGPLFIQLGAHVGEADGATVLAAAGLQSEVTSPSGDHNWSPARVLEPRAVPGGLAMAFRERILYLPPRKGARVSLVGHVNTRELSFGGGSGDAAEVILPFRTAPDGADSCLGQQRIRFHLNCRALDMMTDGVLDPTGQKKTLAPAWAWVGPFEPRRAPSVETFWRGEAVSEYVDVLLRPPALVAIENPGAIALPPKAPAPAPLPPREPLRAYLRIREERLLRTRQQLTGGAKPKRHARAAPMRNTQTVDALLQASAETTVNSLLEGAVDEVAGAAGRCRGSTRGSNRGSTRGSSSKDGLSSAPSSAQAAQDLDFVPGTASTMVTSTPGTAAGCRPSPRLGKGILRPVKWSPKRLQQSDETHAWNGPEHGARWRTLSRQMDPLADPLLLELAEAVDAVRSSKATVAVCSQRLKTRTGQRFITALNALGARVLPAPDMRQFRAWAEAPRALMPIEELVLVVDWRALASCLDVLHKANAAHGLEFALCGVVSLCERQEEAEATAMTKDANLSCLTHVFPSFAF